MRAPWRVLLVAALAAALAAAGFAVPSAASAATGYRYWSFWALQSGHWSYRQTSPATAVPEDGGVDGWRFALSPDGGSDKAVPRTAPSFSTLCARTPARDGRKRVGLVVDPGTAADAAGGAAPPARSTRCVSIRADATSADVLAAAEKPLRYDGSGLLCAVHGYPASGCGEPARLPADGAGDAGDASASPSAPSSSAASRDGGGSGGLSGGSAAGIAVAAVLVAGLVAGAVVQSRRRRAGRGPGAGS